MQFDLKMLLPVHQRKEQVLLDGPRIFSSLIRGLEEMLFPSGLLADKAKIGVIKRGDRLILEEEAVD